MRVLGLVVVLAAAGTCRAGETAILVSGSRLHVDSHEIQGGKLRLLVGSGYMEMDPSDVTGFEPDPPTEAQAITTSPSAAAPAIPKASSPAELADAAADKYGLPRNLVRSVMRVESGFQPKVVSPKGAIGLMQLMPETARELGADARDPVQNVDAGARYLRQLLEQYDGRLWHALAAYNAGSGAVQKYGGVPPYNETINYIYRIDKEMKK
jgi:soluble lytic murein transglycosylase-like protein